MKIISRKEIVEYTYKSKRQAKAMEQLMIEEGWKVESRNVFKKHYRRYSKNFDI